MYSGHAVRRAGNGEGMRPSAGADKHMREGPCQQGAGKGATANDSMRAYIFPSITGTAEPNNGLLPHECAISIIARYISASDGPSTIAFVYEANRRSSACAKRLCKLLYAASAPII